MNILASFSVLSRREKILCAVLGMVVLMAVCAYVFPLLTAKKTASVPVGAPAQAVQTAAPSVTVVRQELPAANMKNPFLVPPQYRVPKETPVTAPVGNVSVETDAKPLQTVPVLSGIVVSGATRMAILEWGGESETLTVGSSFKGFRVVSISDTQAVLDGPAGRKALNIGG